jgi:uncharacterized damage-inducible protein DinB
MRFPKMHRVINRFPLIKPYRTGAIGALLDEYERALVELKQQIAPLSDEALTAMLDTETTNEDCRSIQTILSHVVYSGYGYATSIRSLKDPSLKRPEKTFHKNVKMYQKDLSALFSFTEKVMTDVRNEELEQLDEQRKIKTRWGQTYDIAQLMEHAIVHILRHRRQIEKFILLLP